LKIIDVVFDQQNLCDHKKSVRNIRTVQRTSECFFMSELRLHNWDNLLRPCVTGEITNGQVMAGGYAA
jgi:hypothetical protein